MPLFIEHVYDQMLPAAKGSSAESPGGKRRVKVARKQGKNGVSFYGRAH